MEGTGALEASRKRGIFTMIQVVLAILAIVGCAWLGWKVFGYLQAQGTYSSIRCAYAGETSGQDANPIDFASLQAEYPGVVAWIRMDDLDIDYPVMQGEDNDFYLHNDPSGQSSVSGSIFLDSRNASDFTDLHSIVYGHNMRDRSMFGSLREYTSEDFYADGQDTFTIYTPDRANTYRIFAANIVDPSSEDYTVGFSDAQVFWAFETKLKTDSLYDTGVEVIAGDRVVTLSTCSSSNRLVLDARLVSSRTFGNAD